MQFTYCNKRKFHCIYVALCCCSSCNGIFAEKFLNNCRLLWEKMIFHKNSSFIPVFNLTIQKGIFYGSANMKSNKISPEQQVQNHQCLRSYNNQHICQLFQKVIYFIKSSKHCHRKYMCETKFSHFSCFRCHLSV